MWAQPGGDREGQDLQIFRATAMVFQGKEAKVIGFSPDQFATFTGRSVLQF